MHGAVVQYNVNLPGRFSEYIKVVSGIRKCFKSARSIVELEMFCEPTSGVKVL